MPLTFSRVCQCGQVKTRAEDGRGIWACEHCDTGDCTRNNCKRCKAYAAHAIRETQR